MLNKKFFVIFSLFMVLLCCFSAASASEDVTNDVSAISDDVSVGKVVSEVDSDDESIAVLNDEDIESVDDSGNESITVQDEEQVNDVEEVGSSLTAENDNRQSHIVLLCCINIVSATSNDTTDNIVSELDSDKEFISVSNHELVSSIYESKSLLQAQNDTLNNNDVLTDDDGFDDDCDDDWEGDDENELDDAEINEILDDIKSSTSKEYYDFVKYLLNTKKFSLNQNSIVDGGYKIFAIENYEMKLYDTSIYKISKNNHYFVSTCSDSNLYVEGFYPNTFHYNENGKVIFDKLYYTWQDSQTLKYIDFNYNTGTKSFPHKYDLRDYKYVTPVKNQENEGNCWAFASIAALESYLLKNEGKTYDFSENNLKNIMSSLGSIGLDKSVNSGGNIYMSIAYFLRWSGPILEKDDVYIYI